jgi:hypothetical protein
MKPWQRWLVNSVLLHAHTTPHQGKSQKMSTPPNGESKKSKRGYLQTPAPPEKNAVVVMLRK